MFDAVRNNKRIVQVFLVLIALPFAFFGLESYVSDGGAGTDVAKVGEIRISQQDFQNVMREQQERLRNQFGQVDAKMLNNPEIRKAILDDLIDQRLLALEAAQRRLFVTDDAVRRAIAGIEAFQQDGRFSNERYEALLRAQGMSPAGFEAQVRRDLTLQQLAGTIGQTGLMSRSIAERLLALQTEQRDIQEFRLSVQDFAAKVVLANDAVRKYYDENNKQFETPAQIKAEYLVLSLDGMPVSVSEADVQAWYDGHKDRYQVPEERRASHILIASEKLGQEKAKAKAEEVLQEVQKKPQAFAELAKKYSDDPGSAAQGGDLGFFGRGMMVKPFEEAAFALQEGQISGVVASDFGFHIIKLQAVRAAKEKPLAEVRGEIEAELKQSAAARQFAERAEGFSNMVYEQSDSLQPAADQFKLKIQQSDWLTRESVSSAGPLANAKLLEALFSEDSIKHRRNTEAIEIAQNTLLSARIVDHKPAALQPFEAVEAGIRQRLTQEEAHKLAVAAGQERLAALKAGEDKLSWSATKRVSRMDSRSLPPAAIQPVFRMNGAKLPAYTGVELSGTGYVLYRLNKVEAGEKLDEIRRQGISAQLANLSAQRDLQMYLTALRARYKVEVNEKALLDSER